MPLALTSVKVSDFRRSSRSMTRMGMSRIMKLSSVPSLIVVRAVPGPEADAVERRSRRTSKPVALGAKDVGCHDRRVLP